MPSPPALVEMRKSRILWLVGLLKNLHHIFLVSAPVLPSILFKQENNVCKCTMNIWIG
jgi:hypothetical protein